MNTYCTVHICSTYICLKALLHTCICSRTCPILSWHIVPIMFLKTLLQLRANLPPLRWTTTLLSYYLIFSYLDLSRCVSSLELERVIQPFSFSPFASLWNDRSGINLTRSWKCCNLSGFQSVDLILMNTFSFPFFSMVVAIASKEAANDITDKY